VLPSFAAAEASSSASASSFSSPLAPLLDVVEFVASHSLNSVEEGTPTVNEVIVTADCAVPLLMGAYYFEVRVVKEPVAGTCSVGYRSAALDLCVNSVCQPWRHARGGWSGAASAGSSASAKSSSTASGGASVSHALNRSALGVGTYIDVQDKGQRPPRYEPSRVLECQPEKDRIKVGWLHWDQAQYHEWIERKSPRIAAFMTHTRGAAPRVEDMRFGAGQATGLAPAATGTSAADAPLATPCAVGDMYVVALQLLLYNSIIIQAFVYGEVPASDAE
jgi:hypothetical protein